MTSYATDILLVVVFHNVELVDVSILLNRPSLNYQLELQGIVSL